MHKHPKHLWFWVFFFVIAVVFLNLKDEWSIRMAGSDHAAWE